MKRQARGRPRRPIGKRNTVPVVALLCEGLVTESMYFTQHSRRLRDKVMLEPLSEAAGCDPLTIVGQAQVLLKEHARDIRRGRSPQFDVLWCVFDVDEHHSLQEALQRAAKHGINVAVSNPCFEIWLWWHHSDQTAEVDRTAIQRMCRQAGLTDGKRLVIDLAGNAPEATSRARHLEDRHASAGLDRNANPSSGLADLLDAISDLASLPTNR